MLNDEWQEYRATLERTGVPVPIIGMIETAYYMGALAMVMEQKKIADEHAGNREAFGKAFENLMRELVVVFPARKWGMLVKIDDFFTKNQKEGS